MRSYSAETLAALAERRLVPRDFLWLKVRTLDTGAPFEYGFWSGVGNVAASVIDISGETESVVTRNFEGAGSLISVGDIPLVSNLTVQTVDITMSQLSEGVNAVVRGYELRQGRVEVYRILFSPDTRKPVAPERPRFFGFINGATITTPAEGGTGSISLSCTSHTQEMTRSNPAKRAWDGVSSDDFYRDTSVVGDWEQFWGQKSGKVTS